MTTTDDGFVQDYEVGKRQELYIYCRLCRQTFPVAFKPRPTAQLRCLCGHMAPLSALDVFSNEIDCKEHADFYQKVYRAAKSALREAGMPIPPSGKFRLSELGDESGVSFRSSPQEEESDVRAAYQEPSDEVDHTLEAIEARLEEFEERLAAVGSVLEQHEVLSEMVTWTYCRRHLHEDAHEGFHRACKEDLEISSEVIAAAKERIRAGEKVRLKFASFKHLAIDLEEDHEDFAGALRVVEKAISLGLKGYDERAERLRGMV